MRTAYPLKPRRALIPSALTAPSPSSLPPRPRRVRAAPRAQRRSLLALALAVALVALRHLRVRLTRSGLRHESPAPLPPALASLLHLHAARAPPPLHIFAAPKPFRGPDRVPQLRALESWLALSPRPVVTLLGDAPGYAQVARAYGLRRVPHVDTTFLGLPLLNSMLAATNTSKDTVAVLINADIILYDDFPYAVRKIRRDFPPGWLAVAARWDVTSLPNSLPVLGPGRRPEEDVRHAVVRHARTKGVLHTYGGIDLWAWDTAAGPLYHGLVPPFVYGRGKYDNWLTHHVIRANKRATVDVSEACTLVHVKHDHHLVSDGAVPLSNWAQSAPLVSDISARNQEFWSTDPRGRFELFVNSYLAAAYGSYVTQMGTILHAPLKLTSCYEHDGFCIFQRVRPHTCRCEHSPYVAEAQNDPYIVADSRVIFCGLLSANRGSNPVDAKERWAITGRTDDDGPEGANSTSPITFGLPLLQDHLLHVIASRTNSEIVFLVVADYSERSLIMELVCSMRTHELFPWLMVAALDDDLYRYCVTRGLPVYLSEFDESGFKDHVNFRELARYQLTYEVLRKGKQVFSIEPSITFFAPLWEYFDSKVTKDIDVAILSRPSTNESIVKDFSYIPSAFVYARPGDRTLDLLKRVMIGLQGHSVGSGMLLRHAACGINDEGLRNMSRCQLGDRAVVHLLDRELFRAIEETGCKFCGPPVLYYSALFGGNGEPEEAMKALRRTGLSSTVEGQQFCALTMQA